MTEQEIWQKLRALESFDIVKKWFKVLHNRELNSQRATEITCAAKQAREYFRNAKQADYTVRSLLTFYGIACLSRATTLLFRTSGGEGTLTKGHGLQVLDWSNTLSGDIDNGIKNLKNLKIATCKGLFENFIQSTNNEICMHLNSSNVDWFLPYKIPAPNKEISLYELISRIPDLKDDVEPFFEIKHAVADSITYSLENGFKINRICKPSLSLTESYKSLGYTTAISNEILCIECTSELFCKNLPQFLHSYVHKQFLSIPVIHIIAPLECGELYSEMGYCYMMSYFMGMLSRYYPTHWISLINGGLGDYMWPIINRAQNYVEKVFPELIIEYIQEKIKQALNHDS
ncbi:MULTISPECIES: YaaC family protein [unclassified Fibrobacter]|uniref:YaaC family protein n=1 Tax=unclassified Fibrobacter TaxID=2634177 RepID=UPI000D6B0CF5|nr:MULTISPECIES: YaaC family protein [unclassified Fibrobacter]PWJ53217.1 YaaC-like protein [Fibrobacter sp. UWR4]PZW61293.1 YaaC-like protein [Fibrobacter sp. UWR1]